MLQLKARQQKQRLPVDKIQHSLTTTITEATSRLWQQHFNMK